MEALRTLLEQGAEGGLLPWAQQLAAAERFGLSVAAVEAASLEAGLLPARYQRNQQMISTAQQLRLFSSKVVVIGCGGLSYNFV